MAFRAVCVALLLSTLPGAGCGTVTNLVRTPPENGGKSPFGGVKQDLGCINRASDGEFNLRASAKSEPVHYPRVALMMCCAVDLPFSLVADVVTWPYTMVYNRINEPIPVPPIIQTPAVVVPQTVPQGSLGGGTYGHAAPPAVVSPQTLPQVRASALPAKPESLPE